MVERRRRGGRGKQKLLGNHQRCWIWGRNAVSETLRSGKWPVVELQLDQQLDAAQLDWAEDRCRALAVPLRLVPADELTRLCHSGEHQGYAARMTEYPYDEWLNEPASDASELVLVCDRIQDPHNFGALLRTAEAFGVQRVLIGRDSQVGVTSHVVRTSAGAVNYLRICRCDSVHRGLSQLITQGFRAIAASHEAEIPMTATDWSGRIALVLGNEGTGVGHKLLELCAQQVCIPSRGRVESLNAAIAGSLLMYEAFRSRIETR